VESRLQFRGLGAPRMKCTFTGSFTPSWKAVRWPADMEDTGSATARCGGGPPWRNGLSMLAFGNVLS
jgi:hypothetical protein